MLSTLPRALISSALFKALELLGRRLRQTVRDGRRQRRSS